MGDYYKGYKGDTRSLAYSSFKELRLCLIEAFNFEELPGKAAACHKRVRMGTPNREPQERCGNIME